MDKKEDIQTLNENGKFMQKENFRFIPKDYSLPSFSLMPFFTR